MERRQATSEQTRARIVAAARDLIATGTGAFSIDAVAERAGTARMTVYYQFGSKLGLLEALFDDLGGRHFKSQLPRVMSQPEPLEALDELVDVFCHFWTSDRIVIRRIRGMGVLDPDFEEGLRARDERRRQLLRTVLGRIAEEYGKPSEQSFDETVDVLYALTKFETFDSLAGDTRGPEEVAALVHRVARLVIGIGDSPSDGR